MAGYSSSSGSSGSEHSSFLMPSSEKLGGGEVEGSEGSASRRLGLPSRMVKFLSSCSGNLGSTGGAPSQAQGHY